LSSSCCLSSRYLSSLLHSLANDPSAADTVIATGDLGKIPKILIWNYTTLLTRIVLTGFHRNGVSQLKFSSNTNYLLSIGQDYFHSLAIYDWRNSLILISCPTFSQKVFSIDFNPIGM
jgi:WD40 repeat protein